MVMCVGEMAQLMEPVRAVPTVRCSAKVRYCRKMREWERISISREDVTKETPKQQAKGGLWNPLRREKVNQPFCTCKEGSQ